MSSDSSIAKLHNQRPALFSKFQYQKTQRNKASEAQKSVKQRKKNQARHWLWKFFLDVHSLSQSIQKRCTKNQNKKKKLNMTIDSTDP
jgi:hypothetical protein